MSADKFAVQRVADGAYETSAPGVLHPDPRKAFLFVSRAAVDQYLDRNMMRDDFLAARLPTTRDIL